MLKKIANLLGWVVVVCLFVYGLFGGWQMTKTLWPGLHDDGVLYSTVLINQASGLGNHFNVYSMQLLKRNGDTAFTSHGQLYYPIIANLMASADYKSFLKLLHQSNMVAFLFVFIVFLLSSRDRLDLPWIIAAVFGIAGSFSTVAVLQYLQGRPEHGIPFVLLVFSLLSIIKMDRWVLNVLTGFQIGLVASLSPLPGVILGTSSILYLFIETRNSFLMLTIVRAIVSIIAWVGVTALCIRDPLQSILGSLQGSALYHFDPSGIVSFWLKNNLAPGVGLVFLGVFCSGVLLASRAFVNGMAFLDKALVFCSAFLLGTAIWKHGISWPATNYCFLTFFPSAVLFLLECCSRIPQSHFARLFAIGATFTAVSLPGLGYLRTCVFQNAILSSPNSYEKTLDRVEELKSTLAGNEVILMDEYENARSAVVFDSPPWKMRAGKEFWKFYEDKLGHYVKFYFELQSSDSTPNPPNLENFRLIEKEFDERPIYLMGFKIKASTPGYGYALYERVGKGTEVE